MKKNTSTGIILLVIAIVILIFPSFAKAGLFVNATDPEVGLVDMMFALAAIILLNLPDSTK